MELQRQAQRLRRHFRTLTPDVGRPSIARAARGRPRSLRQASLRAAAAAALLLFAVPASGAAPKVEPVGALADEAAAQPVRAALEPSGVRVTLDEGPWCELWLRGSLPAGKNAASGALHPEFAVSTLIGVIRFLRPASDFRGQAIGAGLYTLRYASLPEDGDHLGVSEYPDFLLLVSVAEEKDPARILATKELYEASRRVAGGRHPTVLALARPSGEGSPSVRTDERGRVIVELSPTADSGKRARIALVVSGRSEQQ